jgi:hypothetical protein
MLGGAGKYLGLIIASILVPFYTCLALGVVFFAYFWTFFLAAFLLMPMFVMGVQSYKHSIFAGCRSMGLTLQKEGKQDEFDYIPFDRYLDLGEAAEGSVKWHRYSIKHRLSGQRYILTMQEELERLAYAADEVFVGSWIETLPTTYITGVMIGRYTKHISIFDREERSFFSKYIMRKGDPPTSEGVPLVQVYATNETGQNILMKRFDSKAIQPLTKEQVEQMKADFEFIDDAGTRTKLGTTERALTSAEETLKLKGGCEIQFRSPKPKSEGMTMKEVLTIAGIIIIAVVGMVVVFKLMGVF